jgi:hypothetical protein
VDRTPLPTLLVAFDFMRISHFTNACRLGARNAHDEGQASLRSIGKLDVSGLRETIHCVSEANMGLSQVRVGINTSDNQLKERFALTKLHGCLVERRFYFRLRCERDGAALGRRGAAEERTKLSQDYGLRDLWMLKAALD